MSDDNTGRVTTVDEITVEQITDRVEEPITPQGDSSDQDE